MQNIDAGDCRLSVGFDGYSVKCKRPKCVIIRVLLIARNSDNVRYI